MIPLIAESIYWHFPILLVTVSLVYSATRYENWPDILREALQWGARMAFFLISIGVALALIPMLPWWLSVGIGGVVALVMVVSTFRAGPAAGESSIPKSSLR
jgi:hypothetical protein